MKVRQVVQVQILGAPRTYTYEWIWMAGVTEPLAVGDRVEIPPNQVQEDGASATVVALGSDYTGSMRAIVRKIEQKPRIVETGPPDAADGGLAVRHDGEDIWEVEDWT